MAKLGIVSETQFENELKSLKIDPARVPELSGIVEPVTNRGRKPGDVNVPSGLRKIIGEESIINGRAAALDLASDFGISPSSVSAYSKGATSTTSYNSPSTDLQKYLTNRKNKLSKKALRVLSQSLDQLTPDKLEHVKARDLAGVARDMSVIAKNMEPENANGDNANKPQFVVYAPSIRDERSYETIVVNDTF